MLQFLDEVSSYKSLYDNGIDKSLLGHRRRRVSGGTPFVWLTIFLFICTDAANMKIRRYLAEPVLDVAPGLQVLAEGDLLPF